MNYILPVTLDLYKTNPTINAKQNDAGSRYILATITANGVAQSVPETATVSLKVEKADGTRTLTAGTVSEGKILVELTNQTLAVAGTATCELQIIESEPTSLLKTLRFFLNIETEVYSDTVAESTDEFTALTEALAEVNDFKNTKEDKSNKVTSIDDESTDTEYPSAKLLYDQLATKEDNLPITPLLPTEKFLNGNKTWATPAHNKLTDLNTDADYQHITTTQVTKLTNIEENAEVNILEGIQIDGVDVGITSKKSNIPLATSTNDGAMSSEYAGKLDGIAENANNYTHPASHSPSIITQDVNNRFVTDTEKSTWNGKQDALGFTAVPDTRKVNDKALSSDITLTQDDVGDGTTNKVFTSTEKSKLSGIAENANLYVHPNHTGDVTSTGDGATTIANDAVTNAKLANMTRGTVKVGGTDNAPTDLNAKTDKQILIGNGTDVVSVAVSGDVTISNLGAVTIGNDKVSNAKLANMATLTIKGNNTGATADPIDLTVAQTKAMLDIDDLETQLNSVPVSGTSYALTKSLSNTVAGIMQSNTVKGLTATNLIVNGDFSDGTTGWKVYQGGLSINSDGNLVMTADGTDARSYFEKPVLSSLINNSLIYTKCRLRSTGDNVTKIELMARDYVNNNDIQFIQIANPVKNQWYESSAIKTSLIMGSCHFRITSFYPTKEAATNQTIEIDYIMAINLTATYGADNEPDLATCQSRYPNYFDGTVSTDKGEVTVGTGTEITRARYPKLQSVPAITDTFDVLGGVHTQNVQDVAISSGTAVNTTNYPLAKDAVGFVIALTAGGTQTGTVGTDSASGDGVLYYQLATPILTYYPPKSIPLEVNSTIQHEPIISDIGFYDSGIAITDTDYPITALNEVVLVDTATGTETQISITTCTIASGGLSFTSTDLTDGDLVWFRYSHSNDSTVPTTEYTYTTSLAGGLATIQQDTKKQSESLQKQIDELRALIASMAV